MNSEGPFAPDTRECQTRTGQPCSRTVAAAEQRRRDSGEMVVAPLLAEFNGWDLRGLVRSAVQQYNSHGDPGDELSESQKKALQRAAELFDRLGEDV